MFNKILVALDNSAQRRVVFDQALALAQATNASLMLVHVISAYDEGSPGMPMSSYQAYYPVLNDAVWKDYQQKWQAFEADRLTQLQHEVELAQKVGVQAESSQLVGDPAAIICQTATACSADLILVGSHGRKGLSELLLGSVSNYVMHHAPCSVLVVHEQTSQASETRTPVAATAN
ncbi:MAG: universal stress protein [Nodosilinea sp.]